MESDPPTPRLRRTSPHRRQRFGGKALSYAKASVDEELPAPSTAYRVPLQHFVRFLQSRGVKCLHL